mgnify:CR=1 FL=1
MPLWNTDFSQISLDTEQLQPLLISLFIFVIIWGVRELLLRSLIPRLESSESRFQWRKKSSWVGVVLALLLVWPLWSSGFRNFATYFGLFSAGLAIALQPLIVSMAGWLFLVTRRPFRVGDRVQIGDFAGDVLDIRIFQVALMEIGNWVDADQSTGRIIFVPNSMVLRLPVANYSGDFQYIWNEIPVTITFESDWRKAKDLLNDIAQRNGSSALDSARRQLRSASNRLVINYPTLTPIVYTSVIDHGVMLTIRYLSKPQRRRSTEQAIWEDILDAFAESPEISLAYPTTRFYSRASTKRHEVAALVEAKNQPVDMGPAISVD